MTSAARSSAASAPARPRNEVTARPVRTAGSHVNVTSRRPDGPSMSASRGNTSRIGRTAHRNHQHHNHVIKRHGHTYHSHIGYHYHPFYYGNCRYYVHNGRFYRWDPYLGYEWVSYPYGWYFSTLPWHCFAVYVGDGYYYYGQGTWFLPKNHGYEVVETPIAQDETLNVQELPYECSAVVVNGKSYFVGEGTWFVATDNGYQVVDAPIEGATIIEELPEDNKKIEVASTDFFFADNKWYMPVEGGYMNIEEPIKIELKSKPEVKDERVAKKDTVPATKVETAPAAAAPATASTTEVKEEAAPVTRSVAPTTVKELPTYTKVVNIDGKKYYFVNGTWYDRTVNGEFISISSPLSTVTPQK